MIKQLRAASMACFSILLLIGSLGLQGCLDTLSPFDGVPRGNPFTGDGVSDEDDNPPPPSDEDDDLPPPSDEDDNPPPSDEDDDPPPPSDESDNPPTPPTPPLPPPPDDGGDIAIGGHVFTSGFWDGWRGDSQRNYIEVGGHGGMIRNAQGIRYIGDDRDGRGKFGFRVFFTHSDQLNRAGGKHLGGVSSNSLAFRPRDDSGRRYPWATTRIDLDRPSDGRIRAHLYNQMDDGLYEEVHWFSVPLALGRWAEVDMEWHQVGTRLTVTVNNQTHDFTLRPGSPNLGTYLYYGNMDDITGAIEFDRITFEQ